MAVRFEVVINGTRVCVAGSDGQGGLSAAVLYGEGKDSPGKLGPMVIRSTTKVERDSTSGKLDWTECFWNTPELEIGDEITIRVLGPGEFDAPNRTKARDTFGPSN